MWYRYRWWCACAITVLMLFAGFVIDLQELLQQRAALMQALREQETLSSKEKANMMNEPMHEISQMAQPLTEFNHLCARHHLFIVSAESQEDERLQVMVRGDYVNVRALLADFVSSDNQFTMNLHGLSVEEDGSVTAELQLQLGEESAATSRRSPAHINVNPFCGGNMTFAQTLQSANVILPDIRILGRLQRGQKNFALLQLPDNHVIEVSVGGRIGKERVVLEKINADAVTLLYPNQQRQVLRY